MRRYRGFSAVWMRPLLAAWAVAVLFAPTIAAFEHPVHETPEAGVVHAEAAHPEAPVHLEQEEHEKLENCAICVEAGRAAMEYVSLSSEPVIVENHAWATDPTWAAQPEIGSARPRGPPA